MAERKKYGLLGRVLGHSLSPRIHELIFEYTGLYGEYKLYPMEPDNVKSFITSLKNSGFHGLNVTIPYKSDVMPFLGFISEEARKIGSVNTILPAENGLKGYNTDYFGVEKMLQMAGIEPGGKSAVVLGSGGSAKTVTALLKDRGCTDILLVSRDKARAQVKFPGTKTAEYPEFEDSRGYDILINTTPVGMYPDTDGCPLDEDIISGFKSVADLIYNPSETVLLKTARKHGARCVNGLYMLVAQAVAAQEIWNEVKIADPVIDKIYADIKAGRSGGRKNIVLIGMPGSGKTTVGEMIAEKLGYKFVDIDSMIEEKYGAIPALFDRGEDYFRECETACAKEAAKMGGAVIATGGGIVTRKENMRALSQTGTVFFLDRPVENILNDIVQETRPLLKDGVGKLYELYDKRIDLYKEYADVIIDSDMDINKVVEDILRKNQGGML